jgi:hypothetical protein
MLTLEEDIVKVRNIARQRLWKQFPNACFSVPLVPHTCCSYEIHLLPSYMQAIRVMWSLPCRLGAMLLPHIVYTGCLNTDHSTMLFIANIEHYSHISVFISNTAKT